MKPNFLMWLSNWFPLSLIVSLAAILLSDHSWASKTSLSLALIYLVPPLLCRLLLLIHRPNGKCSIFDKSGQVWFISFQLQVLYGRLPFLEELLRCIPGLYNFWLNLWGSKVHLFTYWAPQVLVTDRWLLDIDKGVVIGARCHIGGHILTHEGDEKGVLQIGKVCFKENAIIGARAIIGPGVIVESGEVLPATTPLPPYSTWSGGRRIKQEKSCA